MTRTTIYSVIIAAAMSLVGCIVEFNPRLSSNAGDYLVVDGIITDGETTMSLFWSKSLGASSSSSLTPRPVTGARAWVESEAGASFPSVEIIEQLDKLTLNEHGVWVTSRPTGRYIIETGTLDDNTRYRLHIEANGKEYVSQWRAPQITPPIEELNIHKNDQNQVEVRVDLTGEADGARNYMWSYEETWQTRAPINAQDYFGYDEGDYLDKLYSYRDYLTDTTLTIYRFSDRRSYYYNCWKYAGSEDLLIADTKNLTENSLRDHFLFQFLPSDDRLSVLYHIKLKQFAIADDAYEYFNTLKENTDNTGSIFAPIPSEMPGNVVCTTSPETYVIGFVEVSHTAARELFMDRAQSPYEPPPSLCTTCSLSDNDPDTGLPLLRFETSGAYTLIVNYGSTIDPMTATFTSFDCVDCRVAGGTKRRPSWWPTADQ